MKRLSVLACVFCTAAMSAGVEPVAKSAYVSMLKPGEVFAPVEGAAGAGVEPVVDTDEVFPAAYVEDFAVDGDMTKALHLCGGRHDRCAQNGRSGCLGLDSLVER